MIERRTLLAAGAAAAGLGLVGRPARAEVSDLTQAAEAAWIWGLPLIENAKARRNVLRRAAPGELAHNRVLASPAQQPVTTPNNDTLYSRAWIDLARGPVTLSMPPARGRYYSVALMDMYANNFAVLSARNAGSDGFEMTLIGPDGPRTAPQAVRSPTRWCWLSIRVLVDDEADLPAAHAFQDKIRLASNAGEPPAPTAERDAPWPAYFASVDALMRENAPPLTDLLLLRTIAPLGLGAGFDAGRFTPAQRGQIEAGVARARAKVMAVGRRDGPVVDGWLYPKSNLGIFGEDYLYRAQVAVGGLGALPVVEAMYMRPLGEDGRMVLPPGANYRLSFARGGLPPHQAFWSLAMYEATADGQFYFAPNAINRYALSDRSRQLKTNPDGSLDIWISSSAPAAAQSGNWLPAPAGKPFSLVMRVYRPDEALLTEAYRLPPLRRI